MLEGVRRCAIGAVVMIATLPAQAANLRFDNTSFLPVSLEIPGVMSERLWPKSESFLTLEKGQKVYFNYRGERSLLIEITDEKDGDVLVINELIAKRQEQINADAQP